MNAATVHLTDRTRPLKILQLISGTDVNGALVHCRLLSRELCRQGHEVTIACRQRSWLWTQMDDSPVRIVTCDMKRWPPQKLRRFANWVRTEQFDVIHSHMSSAHLYGVLLKHATGIPVVATAHNRHFQPHWHFNDHVIANSQATWQYHRRINRVSKRKMSTIHCFIDTQKFREPERIIRRAIRRQWKVDEDARVIMIAGDVVPHKGHVYLFESLPELAEHFPDLRVIVVGRFHRQEPHTKMLREMLLRNRLLKRVKWIGRRNNMNEMFAAADVTVVPSTVESLGLIALESMAVGTPVVAARTGGLVELIKHEQNGLLVEPKEHKAIAANITRLFQDNELRQRLVEGGRRVVAEEFSPTTLTQRIEAVYRDVMAGRATRKAA